MTDHSNRPNPPTVPCEQALELAARSELPSPSLLILNTDLPVFPGTGGMEFRNSTNLARLAPRVGIVSMAHNEEDLAGTPAFEEHGIELYLWQSPEIGRPARPAVKPGWLERCHGVFVRAVRWCKAFPSRPLDTVAADLSFRNMSAALLRAWETRCWGAFVVVQSNAAAALNSVPQPDVSVLVMHDIRSLVFARRAQTARGWRERLSLRRQARLYFNFEKKYARRYDLLVAVSETDGEWLRRHYQPNRVHVAPIPADPVYFAPDPSRAERPGRVLFTGMMQHPPNVDAAVYFAREVFPRILRAKPEAEFFIVGRAPAPEVLALAGLPGVSVTGGVPDTRPYFAEAAVFVVPLRYGSGVRQKILEAWCMEKCVVSSSVGAEGLAYRDGLNLAIADDADAMARVVLRALDDPEYRRRLGRAGRQVAREEHNPRQIAADYYAQIRTIAAEKLESGRMRLALDMRWMTAGVAGGLESLARSFVRQLISLDAHNAYTLILPAHCRYDFDLRGRSNFRVLSRDSITPNAHNLSWRASTLLHAALRLDSWRSQDVNHLQFLRSLDADIVYSFPGYIHPEVSQLRQILVVPDIQHEYRPEFFSEQALEERCRLYRTSIQRADHICAISEFTRQTLIERLEVPPEKVTTVLLAADPAFRATPAGPGDAACLRKYRLPDEPFLFFPAHTWRHKNHRTAVEALAILRRKHGRSPLLVCTGGAREAQPELGKQIEAAGLQAQVRFLGFCPREDLPALYRGAGCLVFPSLFEGFGMPVLEAMACGCPVVCSQTTSLPEIAGGAALLVDPADPEALAQAVETALSDRELRAELIRRGLVRARDFSWRRHTQETLAVFHGLHTRVRNLQPQ